MKDMLASFLPMLTAVAIHGLGHELAARFVGISFVRLRFTRTGLRLMTGERGFPSYDDELYCALGGPIANTLAALVMRGLCLLFPATMTFAQAFIPLSLFLGLLNLLPLRGFDGARILLCLLCCRHRRLPSLLPERAEQLISVLSCMVLFLLWLIAVYILLRRGSALSLYLFCAQLFRSAYLDEKYRISSTPKTREHAYF